MILSVNQQSIRNLLNLLSAVISDNVSLKPLWAPSRPFVEQSNFKKFQNWLFVKKGLYFRDYHDLWDWSVTDLEDFWECIWQFSEIKAHSVYWNILTRSSKKITDSQWFTESKINYAEHIFRHKSNQRPALLYQSSQGVMQEVSWLDLEKQVASVAAYLRKLGVGMGDKVVAVTPHGSQSIAAFLATNAIGAVWSQCAPDIETSLILDRFLQIKPKVLFTVNGCFQNGNFVDKSAEVKRLIYQLPTLKSAILLPSPTSDELPNMNTWQEVIMTPAHGLEFTPVPFNHPLYVVFNDDKIITYNAGGCLLEHLKVFSIHHNFKSGDRFFWHDSTNSDTSLSIAAMLTGAIPLLCDRIIDEPKTLWDLVEKAKINHFGTLPSFLTDCMKQKSMEQKQKFNHLQSLTAIGEGLSNESFEWIYQNVKKEVWVNSFAYSPEINSSYVGNYPTLPVYGGEKQRLSLGCKIDKSKTPTVFLQPMPSLV